MKTRNTKQKQIIIEELEHFGNFFTAEDLYDRVKERNNKIGIATVYRLLKELVASSEIHSYSCDRRAVYTKEKNHCHFICQKCKRVAHFDVANVDFIKKKIKGKIGHFQIDVTGICESCLTKFNL